VLAELRRRGGDQEGRGATETFAHALAGILNCPKDTAAAFLQRRLIRSNSSSVTTPSRYAEACAIACGDLSHFAGLIHLPTALAVAHDMAATHADLKAQDEVLDVRDLTWRLLRFADGFVAGYTDTDVPERAAGRRARPHTARAFVPRRQKRAPGTAAPPRRYRPRSPEERERHVAYMRDYNQRKRQRAAA
jgi:hypothetical protein